MYLLSQVADDDDHIIRLYSLDHLQEPVHDGAKDALQAALVEGHKVDDTACSHGYGKETVIHLLICASQVVYV